ncbi:kinetochore protein spc25 [Meredithblackwellia eburnea MCA 4105]
MLGTPRSAGRRLTFGVAATTPSRPPMMTVTTIHPIPTLSLKPVPSRWYADDDEFTDLRASDRNAVDYTVSLMRNRASDRLHQLASTLAEVEEEKKRLDDACRSLKEAAKDMTVALKKERDEVDEAREKEAEVAQRGRALKVQVDAIKADVAEMESKLAARRALKLKQREAYQRQTSKNAPELSFFEDKLGLKIRGRGRDMVQLKFTNIDPGNYNRPFSFDIDVSKPTYAVSSITPASFLPQTEVVQPLLATLNKTRDFYAFIRSMRAAFKLEVRLEKMAFTPGPEGEREKDMERARLSKEI